MIGGKVQILAFTLGESSSKKSKWRKKIWISWRKILSRRIFICVPLSFMYNRCGFKKPHFKFVDIFFVHWCWVITRSFFLVGSLNHRISGTFQTALKNPFFKSHSLQQNETKSNKKKRIIQKWNHEFEKLFVEDRMKKKKLYVNLKNIVPFGIKRFSEVNFLKCRLIDDWYEKKCYAFVLFDIVDSLDFVVPFSLGTHATIFFYEMFIISQECFRWFFRCFFFPSWTK